MIWVVVVLSILWGGTIACLIDTLRLTREIERSIERMEAATAELERLGNRQVVGKP